MFFVTGDAAFIGAKSAADSLAANVQRMGRGHHARRPAGRAAKLRGARPSALACRGKHGRNSKVVMLALPSYAPEESMHGMACGCMRISAAPVFSCWAGPGLAPQRNRAAAWDHAQLVSPWARPKIDGRSSIRTASLLAVWPQTY